MLKWKIAIQNRRFHVSVPQFKLVNDLFFNIDIGLFFLIFFETFDDSIFCSLFALHVLV